MTFESLKFWKRGSRQKTKDAFPNSRHIIVPAFTIKGREFFQFDDIHNIPYARGLTCLLYYREVALNCDDAFLTAHCDAMANLLDIEKNKGKIDIYKINGLNEMLRQRMKLPKDPELVFKLASVVFFDKDENPETYEHPHNKDKIKFWKEHAGDDFFLQRPLVELMPFLKSYEKDIATYRSMMSKVNQSHTEDLLLLLSETQKATLRTSSAFSTAANPQN